MMRAEIDASGNRPEGFFTRIIHPGIEIEFAAREDQARSHAQPACQTLEFFRGWVWAADDPIE